MAETAREIPRPERSRPRGASRLWVGAVIALALVAALITWRVVRDDDDSAGSKARPTAATQSQLRAFARSADTPVYWAGARVGDTYELTRTDKGNVFVRYLPRGVKVGDKRPEYTTIGTYPYDRAYQTLLKLGGQKGSKLTRLAGGGIVVVSGRNRKSVYLAFPRRSYQVEVFDPSPARALRLATSGRVRPAR